MTLTRKRESLTLMLSGQRRYDLLVLYVYHLTELTKVGCMLKRLAIDNLQLIHKTMITDQTLQKKNIELQLIIRIQNLIYTHV